MFFQLSTNQTIQKQKQQSLFSDGKKQQKMKENDGFSLFGFFFFLLPFWSIVFDTVFGPLRFLLLILRRCLLLLLLLVLLQLIDVLASKLLLISNIFVKLSIEFPSLFQPIFHVSHFQAVFFFNESGGNTNLLFQIILVSFFSFCF